jgi:hypothetical protein
MLGIPWWDPSEGGINSNIVAHPNYNTTEFQFSANLDQTNKMEWPTLAGVHADIDPNQYQPITIPVKLSQAKGSMPLFIENISAVRFDADQIDSHEAAVSATLIQQNARHIQTPEPNVHGLDPEKSGDGSQLNSIPVKFAHTNESQGFILDVNISDVQVVVDQVKSNQTAIQGRNTLQKGLRLVLDANISDEKLHMNRNVSNGTAVPVNFGQTNKSQDPIMAPNMSPEDADWESIPQNISQVIRLVQTLDANISIAQVEKDSSTSIAIDAERDPNTSIATPELTVATQELLAPQVSEANEPPPIQYVGIVFSSAATFQSRLVPILRTWGRKRSGFHFVIVSDHVPESGNENLVFSFPDTVGQAQRRWPLGLSSLMDHLAKDPSSELSRAEWLFVLDDDAFLDHRHVQRLLRSVDPQRQVIFLILTMH